MVVRSIGGGGMLEEVEDDLCGDFFDHIDDLLDFPVEDLDVAGAEDEQGVVDLLGAADPPLISAGSPRFSGSLSTEDDLAAGLAVPCEDIAQLEWLSSFVEDSFSAGNIGLEEDLHQKDSQFRSSSPVSVLESSSTGAKAMQLAPVPGRARSKRSRPAAFAPRLLPVSLTSPASASSSSETDHIAPLSYITCSEFPPELDGFAESEYSVKKMAKKKKKLSMAAGNGALPPAGQQAVRKCMHCEITKTPQWRAGPMGPKTLCNACGVRYKSGRLFPEYRPAASPTFIACLHSNSHKKVVEMRIKSGQKEPAPVPHFVRKNSNLGLAKVMED